MVTLANGFAEHGFKVTMLLGEQAGPFRADLLPKVNVVVFGHRHVSRAIFSLALYLRRHNFDVVLSALYLANLTTLAAARISACSVPIITSEHSSLAIILASRSRIRRVTLKALIRLLYPRASRFVAVSPGVGEDIFDLLACSPSKIKTIPNPIDISAVRNFAKAEKKPSQKEPLILAVGRLESVKRFDDLLQAFRLVLDEMPCQLEILGEGPERNHLVSLRDHLGLKNHVVMQGFSKNPFPRMRQASVLVVSSERESFSNVLIEAMALGTAIVSTDCPHGPRYILEDGRWGRLVPVGDVGALAEAIINTIKTPVVTPAELKVRAEDFDEEKALNAYLSLFDEVYAESRQSR